MLAYTTFAVGFVTRPLGGVIFGHFGDRIGRKSMLILTLMIMGVATFLIGLVPTYAQIGVWAPILLLVLRVLQGIGLGGEWGGAVLMTYEYAPPEKRGLYASLPQIGLSIGLCLASGIVALLSYTLTNEQFLAWGWRVAFVLSFVLVLIGLYIRLNIMETPEFAKLKRSGAEVKVPFASMIAEYPKEIVAGMGARYIDGVFFNIFGVYSIAYLTQQLKVPRTEALLGVTAAALIMCVFIPFFGRLSDRMGRTRRLFLGLADHRLLGAAGVLDLDELSGQGDSGLGRVDYPVRDLVRIDLRAGSGVVLRSFRPEVRYTGISFVYQFSGIFASGLTPIIATALLQSYGPNGGWAIASYCVFAGIVSALSALWISALARRRWRPGAGAASPDSQTN